MAHSMSPPQRPAQRPFSPYQQQPAHSPPGIALPPAKRARLSPGVGSPQAPNGFPESPYGPYSASAGSPPPSFHAPQAYSSSPPPQGTMGPPPRPTAEQKKAKEKEEKEKVTDINDVSDALFGTGIDLKEEENFMSNMNRSFYSTQSFTGSSDSQGTTASPYGSFGQIKQEHPNGALQGSGPVSQAPLTLESLDAEVERKHRDAAMRYVKSHEQHLQDPFLLGQSVTVKMRQIGIDQGVGLDLRGLSERSQARPTLHSHPQGINGVISSGPDDVGLAAIRSKTVPETQTANLAEGAKLADVLSLISLATNERLRGLLDEAHTIARGRQAGASGIAPADLQDVASGTGKKEASVKAESITNSPWDRPRSQSANRDVSKPERTVSFTSALPGHLSSLAIAEHDSERARIKRRADRAARIAAAAAAKADPDTEMKTESGTPTATTPATPGAPATPISNDSPLAAIAPGDGKPMTKKEREKLAKAGQTEEVMHKNANVTAAMQLGFGKKMRKFGWMNAGGAGGAAPTNPFAKTSSKGSGGGGGGSGSTSAAEGKREGGGEGRKDKRGLGKERKFGGWKEDGADGKGIQLRDLVAVLARDGKQRRILEKAYAGMDKEANRPVGPQ